MKKKEFDLRKYFPLVSLGLGTYAVINLVNFFNEPTPEEANSLRNLSAYVEYYDGEDLDLSKDYVINGLEEIKGGSNFENIGEDIDRLESRVMGSNSENFINISENLRSVANDYDNKSEQIAHAFLSLLGGFTSFVLYMDYYYENKNKN